MKNKMLVEIFFPASGKTYEFKIPKSYRIYQVNKMLVEFFSKRSDEGYIPDKNSVLCERNTGRILNGTICVEQLELMDNPKLMLI